MRLPGFLILLLIIVLCGIARAQPQNQQLYALFAQANEAFRQANSAASGEERQQLYDKAILDFEKIITDGRIKNPKLYYNLANAYLLRNDVGRAILNFRRAAQLDSGNPNIQKNLAFARGIRIDKVEIKTEARVLQTLFFWHYDLSLKIRMMVASLCFGLVCISLACRIWFIKKPWTLVVATVAGVCLLCFATSAMLDSCNNQPGGVIVAQEVVARQGDGTNYGPSFKEPLHAGTEFSLVEHRTGWFHIKLGDGTDTWIPDNTADLI
jgi:hypothetical protein